MPHKPTLSRRKMIARVGALGALSLFGGSRVVAAATPAQTEGPFYPLGSMRYGDQDNDLVKVAGQVQAAGGEIIFLEGRVLDPSGQPLSGARIEIWQTDVNGRYLHSGDYGSPPRDAAFQGFGYHITDSEGRYRFRTIKPSPYPGRTPHIHVKVFAQGRELTTQFYLDGHPLNPRDGIWRSLSKVERDLVAMRFHDGPEGLTTTVDVIL